MSLYDIVVARKLSGGGGGGGSSDFSTAEVTFNGTLNATFAYIDYTSGEEGVYMLYRSWSNQTIVVPLYRNVYFALFDVPILTDASVTGNAQIIMDGMGLLITGDCTITVSQD